MLRQIKAYLRDTLGLPPFLFLVGLGLAAHVAVNLILKKPITSAYGLSLPLVIGISIETYEILVQYRDVGLLAPGNDPVVMILARHCFDVVLVLIAPIVLVISGSAVR